MTTIDGKHLRDVDLNLLVAFEALMQTRSVTGTAQLLRVGQPSASHTLKRLRDLFHDPLFVKTKSGMTPTPRALALAEPVRSILAKIETTVFAGPSFDPLHETRIFRIGVSDYTQSVIADPLVASVQEQAPGCRLLFTAADCNTAGLSLEQGEIDLALGAFPRSIPATLKAVLYKERYRCVFDAKVCHVKGAITRALWLSLPHVIMSTQGDYAGPLDEVLQSRGEERDVMFSTPYFLAIPYLLQGKRLLAALPARLAKTSCTPFGLKVSDLPFASPEFDVMMVWNARTANEPGALWLRELIISVTQGFGRD